MSSIGAYVSTAVAWLSDIPWRFDSDVAPVFFDEYSDNLQLLVVLYAALLLAGPKAMENREPFKLKGVMRVWNFSLALFSIFGGISCTKMMIYMMRDRSFYEVTCHFDSFVAYDGPYAFWVYVFMVSKVAELMDTVFLVLQKKPLIFLHLYHHLTVMIFCWQSGRTLMPSGLWFTTMNFVVHSVMYSYYFMCSCGLRKLVRPIAPLITILQIAQMVAGLDICLYTAYYAYFSPLGCGIRLPLIRLGVVMYGSYFILFVAFFVQRYVGKGKGHSKRRVHANGTDAEKAAAAAAPGAPEKKEEEKKTVPIVEEKKTA